MSSLLHVVSSLGSETDDTNGEFRIPQNEEIGDFFNKVPVF
jgi:hypothetical protein